MERKLLSETNPTADEIIVGLNEGRIATLRADRYTVFEIYGLTDDENTEMIKHNETLDKLSKAKIFNGVFRVDHNCRPYTDPYCTNPCLYRRVHKYVNFIIAKFGYKLKTFTATQCSNADGNAIWTLEK